MFFFIRYDHIIIKKLSIPKYCEIQKFMNQATYRKLVRRDRNSVKINSGTPRLHMASGVMGCHVTPRLRSGISSVAGERQS